MNNSYTRLRVYHIDGGGLSFSYSVDMEFTLVGGRYNEENLMSIKDEMRIAGCDSIDVLHIPSWDGRCCQPRELTNLLRELQPAVLEIPAYIPKDEEGKACQRLLTEYSETTPFADIIICLPKMVSRMNENDMDRLILSPTSAYPEMEDNDTVVWLRGGRFSVMNTGYVKSEATVEKLSGSPLLGEVGILVVDSGMKNSPFVSRQFLSKTHPMMIIDIAGNNQFYIRGDLTLDEIGISSRKTNNGEIIITSGVRQGQAEIFTPEKKNLDGSIYAKES